MTDLSALNEHAVNAIRELLTNLLENEPVPFASASHAAQPEVQATPEPQSKSVQAWPQ